MERLKQKVASSKSRVLASLTQVSGGGGGGSSSTSGLADDPTQATPTANQELQQAAAASEQPPPPQVVPEAAMSTAWLMAADATAHLTDEERGILLEVFKKEEQFQRDTIK